MHSVHFSSATAEWATPWNLFYRLERDYGPFTLDPCASGVNRKCERWFGREQDGLQQDWGQETVFMNPPYGRVIGTWVYKAHVAMLAGAHVVGLLPARTDTQWWHDYCMAAVEIVLLRGRVHFVPEVGAPAPAPFPSAVVVWRPGFDRAGYPRLRTLDWRGR